MKQWTVYLAGEIHSDWREQLNAAVQEFDLPITFTAPVTDHDASDACAANILGEQPAGFWHDHASAKINAIRTRTAIRDADIVVVRFGEKYRQWNAAFDAGFAAALGKPIVVMHPEEHTHALKEVDAAALAVAQTPMQVAGVLRHVIEQV